MAANQKLDAASHFDLTVERATDRASDSATDCANEMENLRWGRQGHALSVTGTMETTLQFKI